MNSAHPALKLTDKEVSESNQNLASTKIVATGHALPTVELANSELEQYIDTSDEWIQNRVGIKKRYVCSSDETSVTLAKKASLSALAQTDIQPEELDLVIFATVTPDKPLPSAASLLCKELGIPQALAFDIKAACSGFLFAFSTADSLLASLGLKNALIVGAESLSRITDWRDRNTAVLFGDGAGACILQRPESNSTPCIKASYLRTLSEGTELIKQDLFETVKIVAPATVPTRSTESEKAQNPYIQMNGREVFKQGIELMSRSVREVLQAAKCSIEDVALFIPHQSNARMIKAVCEQVGMTDQSKVALNIQNIGNTSAASIPIAMDEYARRGKLKEGDLVLLTAVGSGMTYGSVLFRWGR